jgi:hypothetical protein
VKKNAPGKAGKTVRPSFVQAGALALIAVALSGCGGKPKQAAPAAQAPHGTFNPLATFAPLALPDPAGPARTADGAPGPAYWQNRADYRIDAAIDPKNAVLAADEVITYTNNSPDTLDALWLQLDQNAYKKDSRAHAFSTRAATGTTDGYVFDSIELAPGRKAQTVIADARMQVRLAQPLKPHARLALHIRYHFTIPGEFGGRMGHGPSKHGEIYDLAQWYPRMAVYDDLRGWDTLPYLASEFYLEYGDFDYSVTVPADMLVAGSGELVNPEQVLTPDERERLARAHASDATVTIRGADELANRAGLAGTRTWHFKMASTRDISFSASGAFVWDAARIRLPQGKSALAMSFYPPESGGAAAWGRSTEYLKDSVENFSRRWFPYPWPNAINVGGPVSGMEYPGILFDGMDEKGKVLFWVTAHEIGHSWFPMIVGSNERRDPWIDEGFNTFIDTFESDEFHHGEYGPKRDAEFSPKDKYPADGIVSLLADPAAPIVLTPGDLVQEKYRHPVSYYKSALGLVLLRERILGPERFDWAFRKFIRDWAFRHPAPSDFFRAMDSAAGEELNWFWRGWYMNNWTFDMAVTAVKGREVTIANLDPLVLPATVEIGLRGGRKLRVELPVETWLRKTSTVIRVDGKEAIASVVIDPDHALPDKDRRNNTWTE